MIDAFISYSRKDLAIQKAVVEVLRNNGIQVWTDDNLVPGTPVWELKIGEAIENSDCVVVLMTPHSKESEWVIREINFARTHKRYIIPVFAEGKEQDAIPFSLSAEQRVDLRSDFHQGLTILVETIRNHSKNVSKEPAQAEHPIHMLSKFELIEGPELVQIKVWGDNAKHYINMLINTFPELNFNSAYSDHYKVYPAGTILTLNEDRSVINQIRDLLELFRDTIFIDDYLDQTFALGHYKESSSLQPNLTPLGEIIEKTKVTQNEGNVIELVTRLEEFISRHPAYARSDILMAVPSTKSFNLAVRITEYLCERLKKENGAKYAQKVIRINWQKRDRSEQANLHGNFKITDTLAVQGKLITIIDDIYASGTNMNEIGLTLKAVGARVQGLAIAKAG
jgi:predicted amidophosphoribosyltransferase